MGGNSRSNLAAITLGAKFERAGILFISFSDINRLTGLLAFLIAATLIVIAVAYFDINAIVGTRLQGFSLGCN